MVFISCARHDRAPASRIVAYLISQGYSVVWDESFSTVPNLSNRIESAINDATCFVPLLSPHYLGAWCQREMQLATDRRQTDESFPIVPVLLEDPVPEWLPRSVRNLRWVTHARSPFGLPQSVCSTLTDFRIPMPPGCADQIQLAVWSDNDREVPFDMFESWVQNHLPNSMTGLRRRTEHPIVLTSSGFEDRVARVQRLLDAQGGAKIREMLVEVAKNEDSLRAGLKLFVETDSLRPYITWSVPWYVRLVRSIQLTHLRGLGLRDNQGWIVDPVEFAGFSRLSRDSRLAPPDRRQEDVYGCGPCQAANVDVSLLGGEEERIDVPTSALDSKHDCFALNPIPGQDGYPYLSFRAVTQCVVPQLVWLSTLMAAPHASWLLNIEQIRVYPRDMS